MKLAFFIFSFKDDISYKKVATQSHTAIGQTPTGTDAGNAVDRGTATSLPL